MGLLDQVVGAMAGGQSGGNSALLETVMKMVSDPQNGGLQGLIQSFQQGGLDAYLVPGGVCAGGAGQGRAFGKEVCRFHRADFFSDSHHKKLVHGGVVFSGDALGGLLK